MYVSPMTLIILTISLSPQVYMTLRLRYFIFIENQLRENTNQISRKCIKWIPQLKGGQTKGNEISYEENLKEGYAVGAKMPHLLSLPNGPFRPWRLSRRN